MAVGVLSAVGWAQRRRLARQWEEVGGQPQPHHSFSYSFVHRQGCGCGSGQGKRAIMAHARVANQFTGWDEGQLYHVHAVYESMRVVLGHGVADHGGCACVRVARPRNTKSRIPPGLFARPSLDVVAHPIHPISHCRCSQAQDLHIDTALQKACSCLGVSESRVSAIRNPIPPTHPL